ncbi:MAG TPA: RHS repeat-associated core domain-containing protein, partial [Thermoanaerobaculia bacterium]|nr:RHS repeat-associated core domain-containing protein [Thermoanaerobaculia bacterium]
SVAAYDLAGNAVYRSDTKKFAGATAYDINGRPIDALRMDGSRRHTEYDGWGRVTELSERDRAGSEIYRQHTEYTEAGQVKSVTESGPGGSRTTNTAWDGGGRTTGVAVESRASVQQFDDAGRLTKVQAGNGSATVVSDAFHEANYLNYGKSWLASKVEAIEPKAAATFTSAMTFDTVGNTKTMSIGGLAWSQELDQNGSIIKAKAPNRPEATMQHDARGAVTTETLPDGATQSHEYHASGSATGFIDPTNEATKTTADLVGRPTQVRFPDGTTQEVVYDGARVVAVKDRQNRWQSFVYADGHVSEVWDGQLAGSGRQLDRIEYDEAGRVKAWTNRDSRIEYGNFTFDGLPQTTKQTRYRDRKGLSATLLPADILDSFTQQHVYNNLGERTAYSMPATAAGWIASVTTAYDPMGNAKLITAGDTVIAGEYRNAGRPSTRTITLPSGKKIMRKYGYQSDTGQLNEMRVTIDDLEIAGSRVEYDGLQIADAQLFGISANQRHTRYSYDARSRVAGSITATSADAQPELSVPGAAKEKLDPADFREKQERSAQLDPVVKSLLAARGVSTETIDPPSARATAQTGHKLATWTRGTATTNFTYDGSLRSDDDRFHYEYDEKQRLVAVTEKPKTAGTLRRVIYAYDGNNRRIGRTAQTAQLTSLGTPVDDRNWQLETETTFVWDPISDRLLEVVRTADGAILEQIVHGDMAYDDPLVVLTSPSTKLFPIFDEAAAGTLQTVVNQNGEVVARSINNDPFGGEEFSLAGAAIDNVTITATKSASGALESVRVTMHATEQLAKSSVATGTRLAVVDANGAVVRASTVAPAVDAFTATWTLSASDWSTLSASTATPASLSIAATNTLRAAIWSLDAPILPAPDWAKASQPVFTSAALPMEVRESLANLTSLVASLQPGQARSIVAYDVPNLSLLGKPGGNAQIQDIVAATFQAAPMLDPFSGLIYLRARDYDPRTGTFLQGDPLGYRDSANLYAFAGGDPVNRRDPDGMQAQPERIPNPVRQAPEWRPVFQPRPGTVSEKGVDPIPTSIGARWSLDEGPESFYKFQQLVEMWKLMDRPGAAALGGKTADQLTPEQQQAFLDHRRRLRNDPAYRQAWNALSDTQLGSMSPGSSFENPIVSLPALGGAGGGDDGGDDGVYWNNGWRTADGKFARAQGAAQSGREAEEAVWDAVAQKPGWKVVRGRVYVRDPDGVVRVYDGVAISPRGRAIGLEVKSGGARRTASQRAFDQWLNGDPANTAVGVGRNSDVRVRRAVEIRKETP